MLQCEQCEYATQVEPGRFVFRCNPFTNIKEEACLLKWQLLKIDTMVQAYQETIQMYQRLAPLQEKMFRQIEREVEDMGEADSWKKGMDESDEEDPSETP